MLRCPWRLLCIVGATICHGFKISQVRPAQLSVPQYGRLHMKCDAQTWRLLCTRSTLIRSQLDAPLDAANDNRVPQRLMPHLICSYAALCSLIAAKGVVVQALPALLVEFSSRPECVAEDLSTIAALSAALEFLLLPTTAALSDTYGRRPLLVLLPVLTIALRLLVLLRPSCATLILSRVVVGVTVNYFDLCTCAAALMKIGKCLLPIMTLSNLAQVQSSVSQRQTFLQRMRAGRENSQVCDGHECNLTSACRAYAPAVSQM